MASSKIVLVTGGNNGIGWETVKALLESEKPYHILMGSRSLEKANAAVEKLKTECPNASNTIEIVQIDLSSDQSIEKAFELVNSKHDRLDVLINNAGVAFDTEKHTLREAYNKTYDTNVAGTNVLTHTFIPLLLKANDPRLIFVSGLSHITQAVEEGLFMPPVPAGWPKKSNFDPIAYRCSKAALNMLMVDWNNKLKEDKVKVWAVQPGFLLTDLGGKREVAKAMGAGHASEGGKMLRIVVEGERDHQAGKMVDKNGVVPW